MQAANGRRLARRLALLLAVAIAPPAVASIPRDTLPEPDWKALLAAVDSAPEPTAPLKRRLKTCQQRRKVRNARSLKTGQARTDRNGASLAFAYDRAGRLTEASRLGGGASFDLPDGWGFVLDEAENLLARETRRSTRIEREEMPLDGSGRNRPGSVDGVDLERDATAT